MASQKFIKKVKDENEIETNSKIENTKQTPEAKSMLSFLINELHDMNIERDYKVLKSKISLGKDRLDVDVLSEAIDLAPEWAFTASQLYLFAKERLSKFEDLTFKMKYAELADEATIALEKMKRDKKFTGQITKEKIENWILLNKKEYQDLLKEKRELEIATELFKSLSNQFESKKTLLQTQGRLYDRKKFIISKGGNDSD